MFLEVLEKLTALEISALSMCLGHAGDEAAPLEPISET